MIFFVTIVVIQGIHVIEHILQLVQVYALGIPDDDAFGLLGYVFAIQGTEEWLHLVFNVWYLASLYIVFIALHPGGPTCRCSCRPGCWRRSLSVLGSGLRPGT